MEIRTERIDAAALVAMVDRLDAAFVRDLSDYHRIEPDQRREFLAAAVELALIKGFTSDQGIASYVLALWYLDIDFEEKSEALQSLLASPLPEVRRVHAMNRWVEAILRQPDDTTAADEAMRDSLKLTAPRGA